MGHLIIRNQQSYEKAVAFWPHQWSLGLPVVAEPWLCRLLDFSTQWNLSKQGKSSFIGATVFKTKNNVVTEGLLHDNLCIFFENNVYKYLRN